MLLLAGGLLVAANVRSRTATETQATAAPSIVAGDGWTGPPTLLRVGGQGDATLPPITTTRAWTAEYYFHSANGSTQPCTFTLQLLTPTVSTLVSDTSTEGGSRRKVNSIGPQNLGVVTDCQWYLSIYEKP